MLRRTAPGRVGVFDLENNAGTPIYIHAKICIVDDTWFTCGSDNFNLRSWTTDSEFTCAVFDTTPGAADGGSAGSVAHDLRRRLWAEHLGIRPDDARLHDPADGLGLWTASADALDQWHRRGHPAERPAGRIRRHRVEPVTRMQRLWAEPIRRLAVDPDARPRPWKGTASF
jgi:phosphatidylserine/phosphatidylglycerophosphate/cardiolipin synthase-like enzyme